MEEHFQESFRALEVSHQKKRCDQRQRQRQQRSNPAEQDGRPRVAQEHEERRNQYGSRGQRFGPEIEGDENSPRFFVEDVVGGARRISVSENANISFQFLASALGPHVRGSLGGGSRSQRDR